MEGGAYAEMYQLEEDHWWFRGRRRIIWALLERSHIGASPRFLDAGCGTGRNLVEFGHLGPAGGVDPSQEAVDFCLQRGLRNVKRAGLEDLPFEKASFDLLLASDVIEHVEDDGAALRELLRVAAPGACLVITVPAYQWMWTEHDVQLHHFRRYTLSQLTERVRSAGWEVSQATYFNTVLFPIVAAARVTERLREKRAGSSRSGHTDLDRTPAVLNGMLGAPFRLEAAAVKRGIRLPVGVSAGVLARKPR
jgi:SAM-dependent methyltransferase